MTFHIYPINDLREHEITEDCWCKPEYDDGYVIHKAMDDRESYQNGRKMH